MPHLKTAGFVVVALVLVSTPIASRLELVGDADADATVHRRALVVRAQPLDLVHDDLAIVIAPGPAAHDLAQRSAALVRWMDARGTLPIAGPGEDLAGSTHGQLALFGIVRELVTAAPTDDRVFEAGLFAAWRLRRDGVGIFSTLVGTALATWLIEQRPDAPAFADRYTPTDAEVARAFASEASWVQLQRASVLGRRAEGLVDRIVERADLLAVQQLWSRFTDAPEDRDGLVAFVEQMAGRAPQAPLAMASRLGQHAHDLYAGVDRYRAWVRDRP